MNLDWLPKALVPAIIVFAEYDSYQDTHLCVPKLPRQNAFRLWVLRFHFHHGLLAVS